MASGMGSAGACAVEGLGAECAPRLDLHPYRVKPTPI